MSIAKNKFEITIGADPEFFLTSGEKGKEEPMMACGKFGGNKGSPVILTEEGGFLEDGTAIEFNLSTAPTLAEVQKRIFRLVIEFEKRQKVKVSYHSSQQWSLDDLKAHPEAMAIGCAPDRYAWGLRQTPSIASFKDRRFAGGHIHVGIDPWPDGLQKVNLIRYLDVDVLAPRLGYYADPFRFSHYGYPGLYRDTSYGVEWRSPDNSWCNPRFFKDTDGDRKESVNGFIRQFDVAIVRLKSVLETQGNGGALNQAIEDFSEENGLAGHFSAPASRRKTTLPSPCRNLYPDLERRLMNLMPKLENKKKGKTLGSVGLDAILNFNDEAGDTVG